MMYKSCFTLPLERFINCIVDHDYNSLVIKGKHTPEELAAQWEQIYAEYSELSGNIVYSNYVDLMKDYVRSLYQLQVLIGALSVLSLKYDPEMVKALRTVGFNEPLPEDDIEVFLSSMDKLSRKIGSVNLMVKNTRAKVEAEQKKMKSKQMTRQDFLGVISGVTKFMQFRIDPKVVTVAEFVAYQKDLEEVVKHNRNGGQNK